MSLQVAVWLVPQVLFQRTTQELQCEACVSVQARVSEAQLQGEANCASLQTKLDKSAATMQNVASEHQELSRQRKALDRKLVRCCQRVMQLQL